MAFVFTKDTGTVFQSCPCDELMNKLESFDENKKKCAGCGKYLDKEDYDVVDVAGKMLVSSACPDCEGKAWDKFFNGLKNRPRPYRPKKII